jgi:hypothetical protein
MVNALAVAWAQEFMTSMNFAPRCNAFALRDMGTETRREMGQQPDTGLFKRSPFGLVDTLDETHVTSNGRWY